jgi:DNA mismatch endonuclease (patch repair protein)
MTPDEIYLHMSAVHSKNTRPEILVRSFLWRRGFRFRVNYSKLPGHPDVVLPKYRVCIFINGCFWHGHEGCKNFRLPKKNVEFWKDKIERNRQRDAKNIENLQNLGWHCITIWECELKPKAREATLTKLELILKNNSLIYNNSSLREYQSSGKLSQVADGDEMPYGEN